MNFNNKILFIILTVVSLSIVGCNDTKTEQTDESDRIRIGWQTTWATQGQIVQTLNNTNILEKNNLEGVLVGASYGAPLNEAALAGEVDVIFTADQPAAALIARNPDWVIIGRLMFNRVAIYVPPDSPIKNVADLKNQRIAMPFGAAAQRVALKAISDEGLDPQQDVVSINLDITEQAGILQRGTSSSWGEVDAMAGFDPTLAILENSNKVRVLHMGKVTSVIVMSKNYINSHPDAPVNFLKAFKEAVLYYAMNPEQANKWFIQASQLSIDNEALNLAASVEPNMKAQSINDVSITFSPDLIEGMQEAAKFIFEQGLVKQQIDIKQHIDQTYAEKADAQLRESEYNPDSVKTD